MSESQLCDQFLYQSSLKSDPDVRVSSRKHVPHVIDLNQGSYSNGIITYDATSQLNGSEGFASLRDAYIMLPYKVSMKNGSVIQDNICTRFELGLKCGVWNIIDSLSLELNGKSLLSMSDYKLFWNNFRAQTRHSQQYVDVHGADSFLYPDTPESILYSQTATKHGNGYTATSVYPTTASFASTATSSGAESLNEGFRKRLLANPPLTNLNMSTTWPAAGNDASSTIIANQMGRGGFKAGSTGPTAVSAIFGTWDYMLKIKLTDLHPIFEELDLMANPQIRLRLRVNQGSTSVSVADVASVKSMSVTATTLRSGNICPIMITSLQTGNPMSNIVSPSNFEVHWGAVVNTAEPTPGDIFPFTTSRLYVPFYYLENPSAIISKPVKKVRYNDCYAQYFKQHAGKGKQATPFNAAFDLQLSASIKNAKYVLVMPFAEQTDNIGTALIEQFQSPFDSAPWTVAPGNSIRNWNVRIGSDQCFTLSHDYDFRTFGDELRKIGAINGDLTPELTNGLLDFKAWSTSNRVLVADVSRLTQKDVPQSIQIMGSNAGCQGLNLLVLVISEQEMSYDRLTGEVLEYTTN